MNKIIKTTQTHLIMKLVLVSFGLQFPGWTVGGVGHVVSWTERPLLAKGQNSKSCRLCCWTKCD